MPEAVNRAGIVRDLATAGVLRGYLGEGQVNVPEVLRAIDDIKFEGYANLETTSPSGDVEADTRRNLEYLRKLMNA